MPVTVTRCNSATGTLYAESIMIGSVEGRDLRSSFCFGEIMKYIIMCGGSYPKFATPRQMIKVNGEPLVARTIRLLRENGIEDIAISSNNPAFEQFGVPVLHHDNGYVGYEYNVCEGYWCDAFYPTDEPTTYLFGDVFFSPAAIRTIIETETDDIMFFGSCYPFGRDYPKPWEEPFCFKVVNTDHLKAACAEVKRIDKAGGFSRKPIAWEVWNVINGNVDPNQIIKESYVHINDYTCDIDKPEEAGLVEAFARHE